MKQVNHAIEVIENNCTGCYLCEHICPTGAIEMVGPKSSALAVVNNDKCIACFRCEDVCADDAIRVFEREVPMSVGTEIGVEQIAAIAEMCTKAHLDPDYNACSCSNTPVKEIAAAILNGAHSMDAIALATGAQSGCLMYCFASIHRLLTAHLGEVPPPAVKNKWYGSSYSIHDVPPLAASKYSQFAIAEEQAGLLEIEAEQIAALKS